jgi:predicted MPP superfamily phosphohydrolase
MHSPVFYLFFACYLLLCAYVGWRGMSALPRNRTLRVCWMVCIALLSLSFIAGYTVRARSATLLGLPLDYLLRNIGIMWIVTTPYWAAAALLWSVLGFVNKRRRIFPACVAAHYDRAKFFALVATIAIVAGIFAAGYFHFTHPVTITLNLKIAKRAALPATDHADPAAAPNTLHIAVAADLHLGDTIGPARLRDYVARINALKPDIILLPGDIIDRSVASLEEQDMGPELARLRAPLGVYAVLGNHEGYAGAERSTAFLEKWNIRVLRDEALEIAGGAFCLAGRNDYSFANREPLDRLLASVDRARPIILMDHQPRDLDKPGAAGVDLQFSGHTHGGQIWPVTWIVRFLYEDAHGYLRKNNFQLYVTSGLGLWGFPARIGSSSEIVDVRVEFEK